MTPPPLLPQQRSHLRIAAVLGIAGILATLALFPYLWMTMGERLQHTPVPPWLAVVLQTLQAGLLCFALGWIGLRAGYPHGLDAPWLRRWVSHGPPPPRARWGWAIVIGLLAGIVVGALSLLSAPHAPQLATQLHFPWRGTLASLYGGVAEETECRLFLVSVLVWLLAKTTHGVARPWTFITAIVLAALLFGAGHLPAAHAMGAPITAGLVVRIVGLNAIAGLPFGMLFWKRGLEHAMLAHFSADLVLHVALPMVF